jgi:hypothetical protein
VSRDELHDELAEQEDVPLEEDDLLIQRYLDGTLDEEEALQAEFRIDEDPAFAARVAGYDAMFAALDRSALARSAVLWSEDMPSSIVDAALNRWQPEEAVEDEPGRRVPSGLEQIFGGWRPAAVAFALADVGLVALLGILAITRGPLEILGSWVIGIKDVALFVANNTPSSSQLAVAVPVAALAAIGGLMAVWSGMRNVWSRVEVES